MLSTTRQRLDFAFPDRRHVFLGHAILVCACHKPVMRLPNGRRLHAVAVTERADGTWEADLSRDLEPCYFSQGR